MIVINFESRCSTWRGHFCSKKFPEIRQISPVVGRGGIIIGRDLPDLATPSWFLSLINCCVFVNGRRFKTIKQ